MIFLAKFMVLFADVSKWPQMFNYWKKPWTHDCIIFSYWSFIFVPLDSSNIFEMILKNILFIRTWTWYLISDAAFLESALEA